MSLRVPLPLVALLLTTPALPAADPSITPAPPGHADLYRDAWGVPHIYAEREEDAYYALGWAQAEDRLVATLAMILAVEGRSAAVYGEGALPWGNPALVSDRESLRWRLADEAKQGFDRLPARLKRQLSAHAAGFRAWMREHHEAVPPWAPQVEAWHALAWPQLLLWGFNVGDGMRECAAEGIQLADRTAAREFASNEWAVAPARTTLGRTILLADPHGPIPALGNPFYEYRMKAGELDVTGFALGALPALVHSAHVAWGLTTGGPDVSDCYRLRLDPQVEGGYWLHGELRRLERRSETIAVASGEPATFTFDEARINGYRAPVVGRDAEHAYAVVTPYASVLETLQVQFDAMIRAEDAEEALDAARIQGMFPQNLLIADSEGAIIYLRGGRTPVRSTSIDWSRAVSGDDPETRWRGIHPLDELVLVRNPETGYVQNANTLPDNMTAGAPLATSADYPAYIWNDNPALAFFSRAARLNEVLEANDRMSVDEAIALALDQHWFGSSRWTALLAAAAERNEAVTRRWDAPTRKVLGRLLRFDGEASAGSKAALAHWFWRSEVVSKTGDQARAALLAEVESGAYTDEVLAAALEGVVSATARMQRETGGIERTYGEWFRVGRSPERHYPVGGGISLSRDNYVKCQRLQLPAFACAITPRAFAHRLDTADGRPLVSDGSRALRLVVLGEPLVSYSLYLFGQSDDPASPHWDDQTRDLASPAKLKRVPFAADELAAQAGEPLRLDTALPDSG